MECTQCPRAPTQLRDQLAPLHRFTRQNKPLRVSWRSCTLCPHCYPNESTPTESDCCSACINDCKVPVLFDTNFSTNSSSCLVCCFCLPTVAESRGVPALHRLHLDRSGWHRIIANKHYTWYVDAIRGGENTEHHTAVQRAPGQCVPSPSPVVASPSPVVPSPSPVAKSPTAPAVPSPKVPLPSPAKTPAPKPTPSPSNPFAVVFNFINMLSANLSLTNVGSLAAQTMV